MNCWFPKLTTSGIFPFCWGSVVFLPFYWIELCSNDGITQYNTNSANIRAQITLSSAIPKMHISCSSVTVFLDKAHSTRIFLSKLHVVTRSKKCIWQDVLSMHFLIWHALLKNPLANDKQLRDTKVLMTHSFAIPKGDMTGSFAVSFLDMKYFT